MNSCPIRASLSRARPFPCWGGRKASQPAQALLELAKTWLAKPAPSNRRSALSRPLLLRRMIPRRSVRLQTAWRRPLERAANLPFAREIGRALHGCGGGERLAQLDLVPLPRIFLQRIFQRRSKPAEARALRAQARLSRGAIRLSEPRPPHAAARPAHHHKIWAATAREPWLLPWHRPVFCGALGARSSIYAYSLLVAHRRTREQSAPRIGRDTLTRSGHLVIRSSGHRRSRS